MKKLAITLALVWAHPTLAAESTVLREIMGESTYEETGITDLDEQQLKALERWILKNAVVKRQTTETSDTADAPAQITKSASQPDVHVEEKADRDWFGFLKRNKDKQKSKAADEPRYVELSDETKSRADESSEEPVTQKYVLIDTLNDADQSVEPDLIRSRIDGKFKGWINNKTRFKLENGEVWEQRQASTFITNLDSPEIIIRKKRFGYTMEVPAIGRSVHVRRIK